MVQFKVGDNVTLQASVDMMFCGTSNRYDILDINISSQSYTPATGNACTGFSLSGIQLEFQWVNSRASTDTHFCLPSVILGSPIGSAFTDSNGTVSIPYTITSNDLTFSQSNSIFDLRVCIKNKTSLEVVNLGKVRNEIQSHFTDYISITPLQSTHYLDLYVVPHSYYAGDMKSAANSIVSALGNISGIMLNALADAGLIGWTYVGMSIIAGTDNVIIRIYLNAPPTSTLQTEQDIKSLVVWTPGIIIGIALGAVIILIGIIIAYYLIKAAQTLLSEIYTKEQVGQYTNDILKKNTDACQTNFPNDPVNYAKCVKSAIQGTTNAAGDFFNDPTITQSGQTSATKIDNCVTQYNAGQITAADLTTCTQGAVKDTQNTITNQTKSKGGGFGAMILLGAGLIGLYIVTRPVEKAAAAIPVIIKESK